MDEQQTQKSIEPNLASDLRAPERMAANSSTAGRGNGEESESNIARRTRSHLRIDGFEPDDNLNFPDIDMSLYQNPDSELDPVYRKFLNQTYSAEICSTDTYTDDNDPEYVYNDDCFSHGWRFDYMTELQQDEFVTQASSSTIHDASQSKQYVTMQNVQPSTSQAGGETKPSPSKFHRRKIDMFDDPEFARILNQQLRQHIQLLTQTYLLTKNTTNMRNMAEEAKTHLDSYMRIFKHKTKPSNLLAAMNLVNNLVAPKDLPSSIRLSWRPIPVPDQVRRIIQENPNVFIYPSLLPQVAFSFLPDNKLNVKKSKINFTINEDKLLAFALNEFKGENSQYAFIASLLMAAKTKMQISNHIKNIKRSPGNENNPIKLYYANGKLPEIDLDSDSHLVKLEPKKEEFEEQDDEEQEAEERQEMAVKQPHLVAIEAHSDDKNSSAHFKAPDVKPDIKRIKLVHLPPSDIQIETPFSEIAKEATLVSNEDVQGPTEPQKSDMIQMEMIEPTSNHTLAIQNPGISQDNGGDMMNMDLDDLMAASTTISKQPAMSMNLNNNNNGETSKNLKNLRMKQSMLNLMAHKFLLSPQTGELLIQSFLRTAQMKLNERNNLHLLQLLTDLLRREGKKEDTQTIVIIYKEIVKFLIKIDAPMELKERLVLFLDLDQANACGCSMEYLHWMRFFEFMQHVELYHEGDEALEKKLIRLVDALAKDDTHKVKLAVANLVNKHPLLKRDFDALDLGEKPHPSLFICQEDFDDITEPVSLLGDAATKTQPSTGAANIHEFEHFASKVDGRELSFASQSCPCKCHQEDQTQEANNSGQQQGQQHCSKCNLKFIKGRMYLVNKIKPILAEWAYTGRSETTPKKTTPQPPVSVVDGETAAQHAAGELSSTTTSRPVRWTFEEDREILEFCRTKAEQGEETISFDASTFEELVASKQMQIGNGAGEVNSACETTNKTSSSCGKAAKSAREIAERFNFLMEMYRDENSNAG